jgi:hypothetical protein
MAGSVRRAAIAAVAATLLSGAVVGFVGAGTANAASGGGCGERVYHPAGFHAACISSPAWNQAQPDGYVTLYSWHPSCTIEIQTFNLADNNRQVNESYRYYICPNGGVYDRRYLGGYVYASDHWPNGGRFQTVLTINYGGNQYRAYSPILTLP